MLAPTTESPSAFPPAIADAVRVAVSKTFSVICGDPPKLQAFDEKRKSESSIAANIGFVGEMTWSYTLVLTSETAPALVKKYFGMEVPFDGSDMGDAAGELANVLAGEVVAQLEQRGIKAKMSLPTVVRETPMEFTPEMGPGLVRLDYLSNQGPFLLRLISTPFKS